MSTGSTGLRRPGTRPLSRVFRGLILAVGVWWVIYALGQHPVRGLLRLRPLRLGQVLAVLPGLGMDLAGGLAALLLLRSGLGWQIRRFETWIEARRSGEAVGLRGAGLEEQALAVNAHRKDSGFR